LILGFKICIGKDVSWGRTESAAESSKTGKSLFVSAAEAGFVLPVFGEGAAGIEELFLGERFLEGAGDVGGGVVGDESLLLDPEAAETPGSVGHFFDAEGFHVVLGFEVLDERGEDLIEGGFVFGGETGGVSGEVEGEMVEDGLVFGALGLSAIAAGGFDLGWRGVARHRSYLDFMLAPGQVELNSV
jgi:hypothetical protein